MLSRKIILICISIICIILLFVLIRSLYLSKNGLTDVTEPNQKALKPKKAEEKNEMPTRKYQWNEFQAGINLLVYGHPDSVKAQELFKRLRKLGINSVAIAYPLFQSDWQADQVVVNSAATPDEAELEGLILAAHAADFCVMLRPLLDETGIMASGHWRGTIEPKDPAAWFESYCSLIIIYAKVAEKTKTEIFNIGTELNSLQHNKYGQEWKRLIEEIREVYSGELVYSFNWDSIQDISSSEFVPLLDYVGIDAYFPLDAPDEADVEDLERAWEKWTKETREINVGKPIVITEAGIIPIPGAHRQPYEWARIEGKQDWQVQTNYYEATYNVWQGMVEGIYWWCVTLSDPDPKKMGYSPLGRPAEGMLEQFFLKKP